MERRARTGLARLRWTGNLASRIAAILGAMALALVAIVFAQCGEWAQRAFLATYRLAPWAPLILTPALFMAVVWFTRRFWPLARGSGIPQVMAACHRPDGAKAAALLSPATAVAKFIGTVLILLAGGSAGREGPTVQISASIMMAVNRILRVPITSGVVIAGGAAGVAAAFNTPLAGVAFAIEELAAAFEQKVAVQVMAAVMIAGLVSLGLSGDYIYFGAMSASLDLRTMLIVVPLAGIGGGVLGGLFARAMVAMAWSGAPWLARIKGRPLVLAGGCGLIVAITGVASGGLSWGTGYETTRALLEGHSVSLAFGPAKLISTLATALSGAPGGIFAPSLSVGAGLGQALSMVFPTHASGAIVVLGIVGYFSGVVRAPLTAIIIVMEMTADRSMILPLFGTALIADWASALVCRPKLYHALSLSFR
ncbi:chloride channel protein [Novosphingobium sp. KACC 22771]|uniref:chloride channel protein n=1 Tax=Novosphingobium sp. KACC 22771 TaxID=3025670 RepID=UPI0023651412|nr:chloride channel protein [Novosphingobium sp. KACC 22771]WDF74114.1 chloride channel protein [Novosphingobium sp. KACC 22771]